MIKTLHLVTLAISLLLFVSRYGLMMMDSPRLQHKFFKLAPHINDSILLATGLLLIGITGKIPFTAEGLIITQKLTCVLVYIALGFVALRLGKNKLIRTIAFFGALGWLYWAWYIVTTQTPMW